MKKVFGFLLITVLLWSCGSQFSRSKYDRHMWNRSHGKSDASALLSDQKGTPEEAKTNSEIFTENKAVEISKMDQSETGAIEIKKNISTEDQATEVKSVVPSKEKKSESYSTETKSNKTRLNKKTNSVLHKKSKNNPMQDGDVDAMWIVTLILCFIIPPLGVYLKDGSITGLFWLVLILCLLGGGILFGIPGYFGGLYGVGMILALLRFFDII